MLASKSTAAPPLVLPSLQVAQLWQEGKLKINVQTVLPLEQAA